MNVSRLDQTVFDALDMEIGTDEDLNLEKMSFLEQLLHKQKEKSKQGKSDMFMGGPISNIEIVDVEESDLNDSVINTPISDHF